MPKSFRKPGVATSAVDRWMFEVLAKIIATGKTPYMSVDEMIRDGIREIIYEGKKPPTEKNILTGLRKISADLPLPEEF